MNNLIFSRKYKFKIKLNIIQEKKGFALVVVLWMLAGLSMFVMSMSKFVQQEAAYLSSAKSFVEGRALGESVAYLLLKDFSENNEKIPKNFEIISKNYKNTDFEISIIPWSGLVNINSANQEVFLFLFEHVAEINHSEALELSKKVVQAREDFKKKFNSLWESPDELLKVDEFNYFIYSKVKKYLVANNEIQNLISLKSAPLDLSFLLEKYGDENIYSATNGNSKYIRMIVHVKETFENVEISFDVNLSQSKSSPWIILRSDSYIVNTN